MYAYIAGMLTLAGSTFAVPASRRTTTQACANFPTTGEADAQNFTLSAQLVDDPQPILPLMLSPLVPTLLESILTAYLLITPV